MEEYFETLREGLDEAYEVAEKARSKGFDPEEETEIPQAEDLAERVEKLAGPEGVAEAIRELEKDYSREDLAFKIAGMIVDDEFGHLPDDEAAEQSIRTCLAIITEGIAAAAPIEGITHVDIKKNFDGSTSYLSIYFAGPIRSAGGTAAALAVLTGDFVRRKLNLSAYRPSDREVERMVEEVSIYDESLGLQYSPSEDEVRKAYRNIPVEVTGEPTESETVAGYRDLDRIDTNRVRGGAVLGIAEGVLQKAPKILKHLENLGLSGWEWLRDLKKSTSEEEKKYSKEDKYLQDIIAGRGVFGYPARKGGFRLRYGRARNTGLAAAGVHPATMRILNDHISVGTQLKTEKPGKATAVAPVDSIEGPTVKLNDGSVVRVDSASRAEELREDVEEIISLGDILLGYGEFLENNYPLLPAGYCEEWWAQEVKESLEESEDFDEDLTSYLEPPFREPAPEFALRISQELEVPLHPAFTFTYHDLKLEEVSRLGKWLASGDPKFKRGVLKELRVELDSSSKEILEDLQVPHEVKDKELIIGEEALPLCECLGLVDGESLDSDRIISAIDENQDKETIEVLEILADFPIREKAPTRIGSRMGRPEKTKPRKMSPPPHVLFPIGLAGGSTRNISKASDKETIEVEAAYCKCPECGKVTVLKKCPECGARTRIVRYCPNCEQESENEECMACGTKTISYREREVELKSLLNDALGRVGESLPSTLKGVKSMMSACRLPEPLEKGILREKHGLYVFKDGTVRFDATDLPLTHFRPREIGVPLEKLRELGYEEDYNKKPLDDEDQILELKVQDVLLSKSAADYFLKTAQFVDDLLQEFYDLPPFYNASEKEDLIGHLVIGLAPHTSAGITGRIIGFSEANVGYAHPYFHAAKRRNADGDEDALMLLLDALLNFSEYYLPETRGGSVAEDTTLIAVDSSGDIQFLDFNEFWDLLNSRTEHCDKFEKRTCAEEGWKTYVFDNNHSVSLKPIEKAIRYRSKEELYRVHTQFGRHIDITKDHSLFRYNNGIEEVAGEELEEGDMIIAPRHLPVESERITFDVTDYVNDPYVVIDDEVEQMLTETWKRSGRGSSEHRAFNGGLSKRLSKKKVSFDAFEEIAKVRTREVDEIRIGLKGSSQGINRFIDLDENFAWLLGLFVADGSMSEDSPCIHNSDEEVVERVIRKSSATLGCRPVVKWSNKAFRIRFPQIFRKVLNGIGFEDSNYYDPSDKIVPNCILRSSKEIVLAFLEGFIEGDGSITSNDNHTTVSFHTTSEDVKDSIVLLLHRIGLVSNISMRERGSERQPIYTISISGGAERNPLLKLLRGEKPYQRKSLVVPIPSALMEIRKMDISNVKKIIPKYLKRRKNISLKKLEEIVRKLKKRELPNKAKSKLQDISLLVKGELSYLRVKKIEKREYEGYLYDLQVGGEPIFTANWLFAHNSMDAPLVLTPDLDPSEIDDEAHNVDVDKYYSTEFYEATLNFEDPSDILTEVNIVKDRLESNLQYEEINFSEAHNPTSISAGPRACRYKSLGPMEEKVDSQLTLARKIRAVDESDVAERLIENHFIPDLRGNLRAFSRQKFRCPNCNSKYRRVPLSGKCTRCGNELILTVTKGGVEKYMDVALRVAEDYGVTSYTKQRLSLVEEEIESLFVSDIKEQLSLADFA